MMEKRWIVLLIAASLLIVSVVILNFYPAHRTMLPATEEQAMDTTSINEVSEPIINRLELMFSHQDHFFDEGIEVSIFATIPNAVIHYTIDGAEPTTDSPVYEKPVLLNAPSSVQAIAVYPLKAIAVHNDTVTRPLVHTYFIGKEIRDRFDVLVFSLSTNDEYLYDYDTGILVPGRLRDEYIKANPRVHIDPPAPANFNLRGFESERPMYVEVFEPDGQRVIAQAAGVRAHGGWSRAELYKSLRIIPRSIYEPDEGRFRYDFFPDDVKEDSFGTPIIRYDQLVLSNNANDRNFAMLRQEVNYALARSAGLRVTPPFRAVAVFLNGEYYGFSWLNVSINEQYLEDIYSAPTQDFQTIGNGEWWIATEDADEIAAMNHFNSFYNKDFTDDNVLAEFEAIADIDNLLLYYAYQTFAGNRDWPSNNLVRWRYTGPQEEGLAPELDGRWRYAAYDLDFLMSLYEDNVRPGAPSFRETVTPGGDRYSYMLAALFARPDMADKYAMFICDIAANIMTAENVEKLVGKLYGEAYREIGFSLESRKYDHWVSRHSIENNHANMVIYTEGRAEAFMKGMRDHFGWDGDMFTVEVTGSDAIIGSQAAFSSTYFAHLTIPIRPNLSRYTVFDHWVLNGEEIYTPKITVSKADAKDGVIRLELVTFEEKPSFTITQAYGSSARNGAVLSNTSEDMQNTGGLYFTDDLTNPLLWPMPLATLAPGETLEFAGRGSNDSNDVHKILMGFNVREGRVLYLCNEAGDVLDWMVVND